MSRQYGDFGPILKMVSMDTFGFYIQTPNAKNLYQWQPYIEEGPDGRALLDNDQNLIEDCTRIELTIM